MDEIFENAERSIDQADSAIALKQALARFLVAMFSTRPAVQAHMGRIMLITLDRADDLEGKRRAAQVFVRSIRDEMRTRSKVPAAAR